MGARRSASSGSGWTATISSVATWLAKVYVASDTEFPAPRGPGYTVRYSVERVGGVGPWAPSSH
jgi:hypothetical protein